MPTVDLTSSDHLSQHAGAGAASNGQVYGGAKSGEGLCNEADHANGGPTTPLYNYASA